MQKLLRALPNAEEQLISDRFFAHHDFIVGSMAKENVYDRVVDLFDQAE